MEDGAKSRKHVEDIFLLCKKVKNKKNHNNLTKILHRLEILPNYNLQMQTVPYKHVL